VGGQQNDAEIRVANRAGITGEAGPGMSIAWCEVADGESAVDRNADDNAAQVKVQELAVALGEYRVRISGYYLAHLSQQIGGTLASCTHGPPSVLTAKWLT
jgi:hypothetical protein